MNNLNLISMEGNTNRNPDESGPYPVSAERMYRDGGLVFKYLAYFDEGTNSWYKYDPFVNHYTPLEKFEGVLAWANDVGVFLKYHLAFH